jgi:glucose-1-phosphate adenylyltransferase
LQKHLRDGWSVFNPELGEYITPVPPQMRTGDRWYEGTADAIHQNKYLLERSGAESVLILSADHIYRMDYSAMVRAHGEKRADVTVACMEVPLAEAHAFGIVRVDDQHRIVSFEEKPERPAPLPDNPAAALASMGIYIFSMELLLAELRADHDRTGSTHDFGKDILPRLLATHHVAAYRFGGDNGRVTPDRYWRDVGTLDAYYAANMDLLERQPPLDLYQEDWPIRTHQLQTPPARTVPGDSGSEGIFINSIVAGGVIIEGGSVQRSILFPQVYVGDECFIEESILFQGVKVGEGSRLRRCIIDKNVVVPPGTRVGYDIARDRERFTVSDKGIVVIPRNYDFPQSG